MLKEQKILVFDPRICTGCRSCEVACSFRFYKICNYEKAHIRHRLFLEKETFEAIYCQHCEDPLCAASCPVKAIKKNEETGIVKINSMKCIGCQNCNIACPVHAPQFDKDRKISVKCNLCDGKPECVKFCSTRAMRLVDRGEADRLLKEIYDV